jgi:predicted transcriptional regulator
MPVVDRHGKLIGLFRGEQPPHTVGHNQRKSAVADVMVKDVVKFSEDESFDSLMQFFMCESESHYAAVVVRRDQPLGMVYRSGLAALSQPLTDASFAPSEPCTASSNYLLVPDVCHT